MKVGPTQLIRNNGSAGAHKICSVNFTDSIYSQPYSHMCTTYRYCRGSNDDDSIHNSHSGRDLSLRSEAGTTWPLCGPCIDISWPWSYCHPVSAISYQVYTTCYNIYISEHRNPDLLDLMIDKLKLFVCLQNTEIENVMLILVKIYTIILYVQPVQQYLKAFRKDYQPTIEIQRNAKSKRKHDQLVVCVKLCLFACVDWIAKLLSITIIVPVEKNLWYQ